MTRLISKQNNYSWLFNDISLVFVGSALSMMVNSLAALIIIAFVFVKHLLFGDVFRSLYSCAGVFVVLLFVGLADYLLMGVGDAAIVIRDYALLVMCLCIGMSLGCAESSTYLKEGLLGIRNYMVFACFVSFIMEVLFRTKFDVNFSHVPFQTAPIIGDLLSYRCQSYLGHPIVFAHMLISAAVVSYFYETSPIKKWGTILLFLVFVFLTRSRSAWLIVGFYLLFAALSFLLSQKIRHWNYVVLALPFVAIFLAWLFASDLIPMIVSRFSELSVDSSYSQRSGAIFFMLGKWVNAPLMWLFGSGDNASSIAMSETKIVIENFTIVDNGWVTLLFNFGLLGIISMVYLFIQPLLAMKFGGDRRLCLCVFIGFSLTFCLELCFYETFGWFVPFALLLIFSGYFITSRMAAED